jgi:hypothetical protein
VVLRLLIQGFAFVLVATGAAHAVAVRVEVKLAGEIAALPEAVPMVILATPESPSTPETRTGELRFELDAVADEDSTVELGTGSWRLGIEASGFWSPGAIVAVNVQNPAVRLDVWQAGRISAKLKAPGKETLPEEVLIGFESAPSADNEKKPPKSHVVCPVKEDVLRCELPVGTMDLQLLAEGFIKEFLWDIRVKPSKLVDLGEVDLRRGSSVRGWLTTEDGLPASGATLDLMPRIAGQERDAKVRARVETLTLSAASNHRGFFQFDAVPFGDYVITAEKDHFGESRGTVRVLSGKVTEISDPPLILQSPQTLQVFLDPPTLPDGERWTARLLRLDTSGNAIGVVQEADVPAGGIWEVDEVPVGDYFLLVGSPSGEQWFDQLLKVEPGIPPIFVTVPIVEIEGSVTFGDEPLPARLWFGGKRGRTRVTLSSDREGRFAGLLPRSGRWKVEIEATEPAIRRDLQVEVSEGEEIELTVPDTSVRGMVVDESGRGVGRAIVRVTSQSLPGMTTDLRPDDEGHFEAIGLPSGPATFVAEDSDRYSDQQELVLAEGDSLSGVRLVLRPVVRVSGRVVSEDGHGVVGARIKAVALEVLNRPVFMVLSDAEGSFSLELPAATRNVILNVGTPGFGFRIFSVPLPSDDQPLVIPVASDAGTLVVDLPEELDRTSWDAPQVAILHDGGYAGLYFLQDWARFQGSGAAEPEQRFVVPSMEPGEYVACLCRLHELPRLLLGLQGDLRCVRGHLSAAGELQLSLAAADPRSRFDLEPGIY